MVLSSQQIKERIQKPQHKTEIQLAIQNEERVRFHSKTAAGPEFISSYYKTFKDWVQKLLPEDQFKVFLTLLTIPISTNEICDAIFSELNKVFKSGNKRIESTFVRSEFQIDFANFLQESRFEENFELHAKELMRNYINSIIVIDLPETSTDGPAQPYYYDINISSVQDIELDKDGNILMVLFKDKSGKYISVDTEKYCVFQCKDDNKESQSTDDYTLLLENFHQLGFTPACFFWSQSLDKNLKAIKQSPINKSLGAFDWYLFFHTSRKYLEMYASYPITSVIINDCEYKNEQGHTCEGGKVKYVTQMPEAGNSSNLVDSTTYVDCPECKRNRLVGPGSMYGVTAPTKDEPNLLEAVKRLPAERESLDYNQEEEERKKNLLILYNTGIKDSDLKQAQNETQIIRGFESSQSILENVATNISKVHHFILHTYAKLRYSENHVSTVVNYGDEFYEISEDKVNEEYKIALEGTAPIYEIDTIRKQKYLQKYKNDPRMLARIKILQDLEPWPTMSIEQVLKLPEKFIDANIFSLKINLAKFVSIFESENGDIVDFASSGVSYSNKIKIIKQKLLEYGKEYLPTSIGQSED